MRAREKSEWPSKNVDTGYVHRLPEYAPIDRNAEIHRSRDRGKKYV